MPDITKRIKEFFNKKAAYPVYQLKYGVNYGVKAIGIFERLIKSEVYSQDKLLEFQNVKFKRLITHAYENVPHYRKIMDERALKPEEIKSIEDIKYFPILTKDMINENINEFVSGDINKRNAIAGSTGGTTGKPLMFFRDLNTRLWTEAASLRGMSWAKYKIGAVGIDFRTDGWPSLLGKLRGSLINCNYFPALANETELVKYFTQIRLLEPFFITGYSSNLYRISSILDKHDIRGINIPIILSTAEMLYDYQRKFIERYFSGTVFDYYGCNEIGSIAYECEYNSKHITDEHLIVETIDSNGNNVVDSSGEITITDLDNFSMPFIRYKNGDIGQLTYSKCNCGRGLKVLKNIEGRTQEFLMSNDGNYVPAIYFPTRFRNLRGIEQYQIIQNDLFNITLKIVKNHLYTKQELTDMIKVIKEKIGDQINVTIEECSDLPLTGRGKRRLVITYLTLAINTVPQETT